MAKDFKTNLIIGGKLNPSLQNAFNKVSKMAGNTSSKINKIGSLTKKVFSVAGVVTGGALGAGLVAVGKEGIKLASNLAEVQNVVDTTFGKSASQINTWSQTALNRFGLSELQAKQFSSTLGAMMKSSGLTGKSLVSMSENLAGLSGDLASFYNLSQEDAFEKIRSGISGETEPLKQLGINMSVANLQAFALSKGIKTSYQKMDQASQVALRYSYLMKKSNDAQGDFAKTQGTYANQTKLLKTNIQQLSAKIASGLLPILTNLAQKGNDVISKITSDPAKMQAIQDKIKGIADKIGDVFTGASNVYSFIKDNWTTIEPIIWGIVAATTAYKVATIGLFAAQKAGLIINELVKAWEFATLIISAVAEGENILTIAQTALNLAMELNPIGLITTALIALAGVVYLVVKNWNAIVNALANAWNWFNNLIKTMPDFAIALTGPLAPLLLLIKHFEQVKNVVGGAIDAVKKFFGFGVKDTSSTNNKTVKTPATLKKHALGGISSKPAIFGEAGPEIAIPLKRTPRSRGLLEQANRIIAGGNGNIYYITYAPQVSGTKRGEIESSLQSNYEIFKAWLEQYFAEKKAVSF